MVSRQQIETLESRLESAMYQIGRARKYLFELVDKHNLDRDNPLWTQQPYDSEGTKFFDVTPQEADAFDAMSEIDRTAWFELQLGKLDVERQQQLTELPNDVRAALIHLKELEGLDYSITRKLANKLYQRGLIGLIADRLGFQEDSDVEEYLDIPDTE
jgi:hypothetical protein